MATLHISHVVNKQLPYSAKLCTVQSFWLTCYSGNKWHEKWEWMYRGVIRSAWKWNSYGGSASCGGISVIICTNEISCYTVCTMMCDTCVCAYLQPLQQLSWSWGSCGHCSSHEEDDQASDISVNWPTTSSGSHYYCVCCSFQWSFTASTTILLVQRELHS